MKKESNSSYIEKAKNSPTFCILPFAALNNRVKGDFAFCCKSHPVGNSPLGNVQSTTMKEVWNNEESRKIRHQMLNGEKPPACSLCWMMEEEGVMSKRLQSYSPNSQNFEKYSSILNHLTEDCELPFEIPRLDVEFSNLCNLRCRMCNVDNSTKWIKDHETVAHLTHSHLPDDSSFHQDLVKKHHFTHWEDSGEYNQEILELRSTLSHIDFAGGEPLIDPYHYKFLKLILPYGHQITLNYSTNLYKYFKKDIPELWKKFKSVSFMISIDGLDEIYNYIRQDANFKTVENNIRGLQKSSFSKELCGAFCLQIYNAFSICETFDYFIDELHFDSIHSNPATTWFLDVRIIPPNLKEDLRSKMKKYYNDIDHKKWSPQIKHNVKKYIKQSIGFLNSTDKEFEQTPLNHRIKSFVEFSDTLDQRQNVKHTWRELLPDLAEEIEKMK